MLKSLEPPKNSEQSPYFITTYRSIIIQVLRKLSEVVRAQLFFFRKESELITSIIKDSLMTSSTIHLIKIFITTATVATQMVSGNQYHPFLIIIVNVTSLESQAL
jgi:hypothetical protein